MKNKGLLYWLNNFESYISCGCFLTITGLLTIQVVSRYIFGHAITWTEEISTILFVVMIYTAIAAAVTERKHIRIEALISAMPFKIRRIMLIVSNLIFIVFCIIFQPAMFKIIDELGSSVYPLSRVPKAPVYAIMPACLLLTAVRIIQDILRLLKENEDNLGNAEAAIDLDAMEREYLAKKALKEGRKEGEE